MTTEATEVVREKKSDLKLFGEIEKRVAEMQEPTKGLLVAALEDGVSAGDLGLLKQVVERYSDLSDKGREYVDGTLGVDREPKP